MLFAEILRESRCAAVLQCPYLTNMFICNHPASSTRIVTFIWGWGVQVGSQEGLRIHSGFVFQGLMMALMSACITASVVFCVCVVIASANALSFHLLHEVHGVIDRPWGLEIS